MSSNAHIIRSPGQYIYIPSDSRERFLTSPASPGSYFASHDIRWAGLSNLTNGYRVERKDVVTPQILYVLEGSGQLRIKKGANRKLRKGDVFIAPTVSEYSYWTDQNWNIMWINFNPRSKWDRLIGSQPHVHKATWLNELHYEMEACLKETNRRWADSSSALHCHVNLIVLYLQRELGVKNPDSAKSHRILENIWNEVQLHIDKAWNVDQLAELAHMSKSGFQRIVKKHTGLNAMQIVHTMRMENAGTMLLYTDYTLDTISRTVGYSDQFAFAKAFKRHTGTSPGQFRAQNKN
ncbi:MAG: AraC family transcriptional regulator [Kiritimatiellales bacterium]